MCGIVGTFGFAPQPVLETMLRATRHRGEDESDIKTWDGICGLGINRLSIMDVARGHQPLSNANGDIHVVCNGEIYNYHALRHDLDRDKVFSCDADVEVIAHLYEDHGTACVELLDGMFAFVLYDARRRTFLAARDRFGIKPLYYIRDAGQWYFASEIKAFLGTGANVEDIQLLPPGHYLTEIGLCRYYDLEDHQRRTTADPKLLYEILDAAVRRHLMADPSIKIGTFLSGGVDSSIVTAIAARYRPDLTAFTVGTPESVDVADAASLCAHLGIEHVIVPFSLDQIWPLVPNTVYQLENYHPLIVLEGLMQMMLSKAARERGIKVMLSGEGADEIFAGYHVYRDKTPEITRKMLRTSVAQIHNTECMRLDRATMAHSIEARVPFLDSMLVEYAVNLPVAAMLRQDGGRCIEKWILRKASEQLLPAELAWRPKLGFLTGSGIAVILDRLNGKISDEELRSAQQEQPQARIWGKASLFFYRIFRAQFGHPAGDHVSELFGEYPILQSAIDEVLSQPPSVGPGRALVQHG